MRLLRIFRLRLRSVFRSANVERDLHDELRDHLERQIEVYRASGMSPADAGAAALRDFGGVVQVNEQCRDMRRVNWFEDLRRDVAYAFRSLRRTPGFTVVAILSLALGIGANTAIFSVVNVLMLRDLPVTDPHELVEIGRVTQYGRGNFSYPIYERLRDGQTSLNGIFAVSTGTIQATSENTEDQPRGRFVTGNFFEVLGISPAVGRLLSASDDRPDAREGPAVAAISYGLWQRRFGGSPDVVGTTLKVNEVAFTIVGVVPRSFEGLAVDRSDDFYIPMASEPRLRRPSWLGNPGFNWLTMAGRVKRGVAREAAAADLGLIFGRFLQDAAPKVRDAEERKRILEHRLVVESARSGLSAPRREFSKPVLLLMGAVVLVLLIACANVVNLLLARALARRHEIALRLAVGASRGRLVRQLLTESAVLGLLGGAIGFGFALQATRLIGAYMAEADPATSFDLSPDGGVLVFSLLISLGSALLAGIAPALRLSRTSVAPAIQMDARMLRRSGAVTLWGRALIAGQVALSLLLLAGATLLISTLRNLQTFDAGFDRDRVLLIGLNPAKGGQDADRSREYYRQVVDRARSIPGVRSAGVALVTPISGGGIDFSLAVEGRAPEPGAVVYVNYVSDGYFQAMGTPLLRGRDFRTHDGPRSSPVIIVNDALARRYFKEENPVGRRVTLGPNEGLEVAGVVANAKYLSLREEDHPTAYVHALQKAAPWGLQLVVGTAGAPLPLAPAIRRAVQEVATTVPVSQPALLTSQIDRSLAKERMMTRVLSGFAAMALLLAFAGLYAVLGYAVTRRTQEIGIRMALGASRGSILRSVLRDSCTLVAAGVAIGVPAALGLTRLLSSLLFGVTPTDPWVLGGVVVCLFVVAPAAASLPAWRASRVDPLVALRQE